MSDRLMNRKDVIKILHILFRSLATKYGWMKNKYVIIHFFHICPRKGKSNYEKEKTRYSQTQRSVKEN